MSDMRSVSRILEVIKTIASNQESGRLEIVSSGARGTLLFHEGKLVDARLGSLSGFQAVNAAVALVDAEFNFDHVAPAQQLSSITPAERVVLKSFFGIEAADTQIPATAEPEIHWNPAPEPVVPLNEAPTIPLGFFFTQRLVLCLVLLIALAGGAIALRRKFKATPQPTRVTTGVESQRSPVTEPQPEIKQVAAEPETAKVQDLTGEWQVINTIQKTEYKAFNNMKVGFRLKIDQQGKEFTGKGEKFSENGQTLPVENRTPIHVTGSIEGDQVLATFVEDGKLRKTNGRFVWKLQKGTDQLAGNFVTTAANSSGKSAVTKQQ